MEINPKKRSSHKFENQKEKNIKKTKNSGYTSTLDAFLAIP